MQLHHPVFVVDAEVVDHHVDREHPHDNLINENGNIHQMDLRVVKDNQQQHEQERGGYDHDEVAFEQGIQFSPEKSAEDKRKYRCSGYRKIQISRQSGQDGLVAIQSRDRSDHKHRCDKGGSVIDRFPQADDLRRQLIKDEDENKAQEHLHDRNREDDAGYHYMEGNQPYSVLIKRLRFHPADVRKQKGCEHQSKKSDKKDADDLGCVPFLVLQQQENTTEHKPGKYPGEIRIVAAHSGPIDLHITFPHPFRTNIAARQQRIPLQFHYISTRRYSKKRPSFCTRTLFSIHH